jgi:hypothetical protein
MLAVTLPEPEILPLLSEDLSISLINGPNLCVVAGPVDAMAAFEKMLNEKGVICRHVQNAHAFHSRMLNPIVEAFEAEVRKVPLNAPQIPFISNVTGTWISSAEATDPAYWARHANHSARFTDALHHMWQLKNAILLEAGPGRTLGVLAMQHPDRNNARNPVPFLPCGIIMKISRTLSFYGTASESCGCREWRSTGKTFTRVDSGAEYRCRLILLKGRNTGWKWCQYRMRPLKHGKRNYPFIRTRIFLDGFTCLPGNAFCRRPLALMKCPRGRLMGEHGFSTRMTVVSPRN